MSLLPAPINGFQSLTWRPSLVAADISVSKVVPALCQTQQFTANVPLLLNGYLPKETITVFGNSTPYVVPTFGAIGALYARSINILGITGGSFAGTSFTIVGILNGCIISEQLNGPSVSSAATSKNFYNSIISITPNNNSGDNNIAVDAGYYGITPFFIINNDSSQILNVSLNTKTQTTPNLPNNPAIFANLMIGQDDFAPEIMTNSDGAITYPKMFSIPVCTSANSSSYTSNILNGAPVFGRYATINVTNGTTAGMGFTGSLMQVLRAY